MQIFIYSLAQSSGFCKKNLNILLNMNFKEIIPMDTRVFIARCDAYDQAVAAVDRILDAFGGGPVLSWMGERVCWSNPTSLCRASLKTPQRPILP
jgi:hypothetical protein